MLQDTTYANELFLLPGSAEAEGDAIDYGRLRERGVAWAVGVPGESAWVDEVSESALSTCRTDASIYAMRVG
jgi:allantoicase